MFYGDINAAVRNFTYDYILIDYVFSSKYWNELINNLQDMSVTVKTIYLKPIDLKEHKKEWEFRSRNFSVRHAGHGATHYHNGIGNDYVNKYETKVFENMQTIGQTIELYISFNPYSRSISYDNILNFIKE